MTESANLVASRLELYNKTLAALEDRKKSADSPLLLIFWGSRGSGKTTFLNTIREKLADHPGVEIAGFWDAGEFSGSSLSSVIRESMGKAGSGIKVVFIDNLDSFLQDSSGQELFGFESNMLLPLIERQDTIIIAGSQIEIKLWQEYDVRERQQNYQLPPLIETEMQEVLQGTHFDKDHINTITFGHPRILELLRAQPELTEKEASQYATNYFLDGLPDETKELTQKASVFPVFDIYILRQIMEGEPRGDEKAQNDLLTWYNDQINELTQRWIVQFDSHVGAYRFTDDAVRKLISRNVLLTAHKEFIRIHQIAADYYQEEAKSTSYLSQLFVSAIYHLAQLHEARNKDNPGAACLRWVREMQTRWLGANWEQVLGAWESGSGNESVRDEINLLIGPKYFSKITELLSAKIKSEV
jgi:energy-coupling factor transporter ATP-binding protein EcfA2